MNFRRTVPVVLAATAALGACGSSDDTSTDAAEPAEQEESVEPAEPVEQAEAAEQAEPSDEATPDEAQADESEPSEAGGGAVTLTVSDGTVYEFETSSCDTSNNTDIFLVDPGYDISGRSDDGFRFLLIRAGFDESTTALGTLEGGFDENGVNADVQYVFREPESVITLDGNTLSGEIQLSGSISPQKIHGDDATGSFTVTC